MLESRGIRAPEPVELLFLALVQLALFEGRRRRRRRSGDGCRGEVGLGWGKAPRVEACVSSLHRKGLSTTDLLASNWLAGWLACGGAS